MPYLNEDNWHLLHEGRHLAAELKASKPENQAFIGILAHHPKGEADRWGYFLRKFEVKREYIEQDYDITPDETTGYKEKTVESPEAVEMLLNGWLEGYEQPVKFVRVAENDYPM